MKHLGFSPFIKEQRIGEKRIPNSNLIYRIVWNFLLWNNLILHVLVACISTLALDNPFHKFCSIFVC